MPIAIFCFSSSVITAAALLLLLLLFQAQYLNGNKQTLTRPQRARSQNCFLFQIVWRIYIYYGFLRFLALTSNYKFRTISYDVVIVCKRARAHSHRPHRIFFAFHFSFYSQRFCVNNLAILLLLLLLWFHLRFIGTSLDFARLRCKISKSIQSNDCNKIEAQHALCTSCDAMQTPNNGQVFINIQSRFFGMITKPKR